MDGCEGFTTESASETGQGFTSVFVVIQAETVVGRLEVDSTFDELGKMISHVGGDGQPLEHRDVVEQHPVLSVIEP